ncbi:MAG: DUF1772 domain-containing protein [Rubrobacteraceae bacterium]
MADGFGSAGGRAEGRAALSSGGLVSVLRLIAVIGATVTTGLISGFFYAYACSVTLGTALLPDEQYIAAMQAINATVRNGVFAVSFFGAAALLLLAVVVRLPRPRSVRFALLALACALYIGGGFLLTMLINVPMNEELATVSLDAPARVLAEARAAYEEPWNFWNGVRTVFSTLAFGLCIAACLHKDDLAA